MLSINETNIKDEVLWNNCNILIDKKPVFFRNWFSKDILHLPHLLSDNRNSIPLMSSKPNITWKCHLLFTTVLLKPFLVGGKVNLNGAVKSIMSNKRIIKNCLQDLFTRLS